MTCDCGNKGREIAVILDDGGYAGALSEPGRILIYRRNEDDCHWETVREAEFSISADSLSGIRENISGLMEFLKDCRIFVAKSAGGAAFFELQKAGFSVWEVQGRPEEFLDGVIEDEENEDESKSRTAFEIPVALEISAKNFTISIKDVQGKLPGISSKKILQDFIRRGDFESLEITCDHVPPWIRLDADMTGLSFESEKKAPNEYIVALKST